MLQTKNDGYLGNSNVKRDGVDHEFTMEEIQEYKKCFKDPAYFARNYVKVIHLDKGLVPFDLYPYQENMFDHFNNNRFNIVLACRQSGKSISSCAYLLWYVLFHSEKNVAVLANKGATAREMLSRITLMLENIPFFLQPGCKTLNKGSIEFSNNSKIFAASTSGSSIRGQSVNLLYLDEFAFVQDATTFYTSTYPVVSSGKDTKVIITSTANGIGNIFHNLWQGAVQKTNEYNPFRVDWWDVPGRDEEWKAQTIANTSELQFDQEFGNNFIGLGSTLIGPEFLLKMKAGIPIYTQSSMRVYEKPIQDHNYMIFCDVAKGRGQDYTAFHIIDVSGKPFKQVATYHDNTISPLLLPDVLFKYANLYNEALVVIESNDQGTLVCNGLYYELEYENVFVESLIKSNNIGVTMTKKVKRIGCSNLKDLIEQSTLDIVDGDTIIELSTFEARGSSYEASDGNHDDLVMSLVLFGWFVTNQHFANITDVDVRNLMYAENMKAIENEMVPFGFIDNGATDFQADIESKSEVIGGDRWFTETPEWFKL